MTQNVMTAFKRGSYMHMYSKLLRAPESTKEEKKNCIWEITYSICDLQPYKFSVLTIFQVS